MEPLEKATSEELEELFYQPGLKKPPGGRRWRWVRYGFWTVNEDLDSGAEATAVDDGNETMLHAGKQNASRTRKRFLTRKSVFGVPSYLWFIAAFVLLTCLIAGIINLSNGEDDQGCWWTNCQSVTWADRGCEQYKKIEASRRDCNDGHEFKCCQPDTLPAISPFPTTVNCWWTRCQMEDTVQGCPQNDLQVDERECAGGTEFQCCEQTIQMEESSETGTCWWSLCTAANTSSFACPFGLQLGETQDCGDGRFKFKCCETSEASELVAENDTYSNTGSESSTKAYEDLVKYLFMNRENPPMKLNRLRCDFVDPGKEHVLQIGDEGIRICDICPQLPQSLIHGVFLDRAPAFIKTNIQFTECYGLCYEDKTCMAFSYDNTVGDCYLFNSTAGLFEEDEDWMSVLMTQPTGVVHDWSYTRHTRLLGTPAYSSTQPTFLHCLHDCDSKKKYCNFASYSTTTMNCSLFEQEDDVMYVDLVYGHLAGIRVSYAPAEGSVEGRFILEGDDLTAKDSECAQSQNDTHSAYFMRDCFEYSEIDGCDQKTGCRACSHFWCPKAGDQSYDKAKILEKMQDCLLNSSCIGVGYNADVGTIEPMDMEDYIQQDYDTRYLLKFPPNDSRQFLTYLDIVPNADIAPISSNTEFEELILDNLVECIEAFSSKKQFKLMSFSYQTHSCKLGTQETAFTRSKENKLVSAFKRPSLVSPALNYIQTPGFQIMNGTLQARLENCTSNCYDICSYLCSVEYKDWCAYIAINMTPNTSVCSFYDDESDFVWKAMENSVVLTKVSSFNFSLNSFDKLNSFMSSDIYNCFADFDQLDETSVSWYKPSMPSSSGNELIRVRRGWWSFFKKIAKSIVSSFEATARAVINTAKGVINTIDNIRKGDFKAAGKSLLEIPIVHLLEDTAKFGSAIIKGDWNEAKAIGFAILDSDGFDLVTNVLMPGGGGKILKIIAKAGVRLFRKTGTKGLVTVVKAVKKKTFRISKNSRQTKRETHSHTSKKNTNKPEKKKNDKAERERGDTCKNKKKPKRSAKPSKRGKSVPGDCNENARCKRPRIDNVIEETLSRQCINAKKGAQCQFQCMPGYREKIPKVTCNQVGNKRNWTPMPHCVLETCSSGLNPLLALQVPMPKHFTPLIQPEFITAYVVSYNKTMLLPAWSVAVHYKIRTRNKRLTDIRPHPCQALKYYQAEDADYYQSGWNKGHLTPYNALSWSEKSAWMTNMYVNVAPQDPFTNVGPWKILECQILGFTDRFSGSSASAAIVATGVCPTQLGNKAGRISVPSCFWKMVCYTKGEDTHVVAFYSENSHPSSPQERNARIKQVFTPMSQSELKQKISSDLSMVWKSSTRDLFSHLMTPVKMLAKNKATYCNRNSLPDDERKFWVDLLEVNRIESNHQAKRGVMSSPGCSDVDLEIFNDVPRFFDTRNTLNTTDSGDNEADKDDNTSEVNAETCGKRIIGYYDIFSAYLGKRIRAFQLKSITHVIVSFFLFQEEEKGVLDYGDDGIEFPTANIAKQELEIILNSVRAFPHVKIMFQVGNLYKQSSYDRGSPESRLKFIASVIRIIQKYGFDGVDIGLGRVPSISLNEYYRFNKQDTEEEQAPTNYRTDVLLLEEMRAALDDLAETENREEKYIISCLIDPIESFSWISKIDFSSLLNNVDFFNLNTYNDYRTINMNLRNFDFPFPRDSMFSKTNETFKFNLVIPVYGSLWSKLNGELTVESGVVPWDEIRNNFTIKSSIFSPSKLYKDHPHLEVLSNNNNSFIGYEKANSLRMRVKYAMENNFGGLAMLWLNMDDNDLSRLDILVNAQLCNGTEMEMDTVPLEYNDNRDILPPWKMEVGPGEIGQLNN